LNQQSAGAAAASYPIGETALAEQILGSPAGPSCAGQGVGALTELKRRGDELNIRIGDLERYGRTLLLDGVTTHGKRVMMWNE
jgi:hypothetical protein